MMAPVAPVQSGAAEGLRHRRRAAGRARGARCALHERRQRRRGAEAEHEAEERQDAAVRREAAARREKPAGCQPAAAGRCRPLHRPRRHRPRRHRRDRPLRGVAGSRRPRSPRRPRRPRHMPHLRRLHGPSPFERPGDSSMLTEHIGRAGTGERTGRTGPRRREHSPLGDGSGCRRHRRPRGMVRRRGARHLVLPSCPTAPGRTDRLW